MSKAHKKIRSKLKYYLTFLLVCLLFLIVILNVNYINNKRKKEKLYQEKSNLFEKIILGRGLEGEGEGEGDKSENKTEICNKTSDKLKNYYKTGDLSVMGIDEHNITGKDGEHIQALINIVKISFDKNKTKNKEENDDDSSLLENLIIYGKHYLPLVIILGISILSLPGWLVCCILNCGNCCWCCCCKKPCCKIPSFVFSYIFYGICALICFYGLGKINTVFLNIADTECSILKFVEDVLNGETKENTPFWPGIDGIEEVLNKLSEKVKVMKPDTVNQLSNKQLNLISKKDIFENSLGDGSNLITQPCPTGSSPCQDYFVEINSKTYQLDLANKFGTFDSDTKEASPENSICYLWKNEYSSEALNSKKNFMDTIQSFNIILNDNSVSQSFDGSKESMNGLNNSFDIIKEKLAGKIIKYGDDLDNYGRIAFKLLFTILILMDAGIAAFLLLLCFCSGKICNCCCCARCFCKFFIHILWNFMAIFMVALFMIGSIFTIIGKIGEDMTSVISYLASEENLGEDNNSTILFGDVKQYLNKCFNGDGNILAELGFNMENMKYFQTLKNSEIQFEDIEEQFNDNKLEFVYKEYLTELNDKINYKSNDLSLIEITTDANTSPIKFTDLLNSLNQKAIDSNQKEKWDITSTSTKTCGESHSDLIIYHPKKCYPSEKGWLSIADNNLNDKFEKFKELIDLAAETNNNKGIKKILTDLNDKYEKFLNSEIETVKLFKEKIQLLTDIVKEYNGENEEMFSFMNCKFIKANTQIILSNLKNGISNEIYTVGIYLLMAAFSLAFGILFTILLIVLLNMDIDKNKQNRMNTTNNGEDIPEYPVDSEGRVLNLKVKK